MEVLIPLASFAVASSITPGPNNLMLAASGVAFGFRRTVPHMVGIIVGFSVLLLVCGLGVGALIENIPAAGLALKIFGSLYLLYLAWTIAHPMTAGSTTVPGRPLTVNEAALFQFANPKGWLMALTAVSAFVAEASSPWVRVALVCSVFVAVFIPCACIWTSIGVTARRSIASGRARRLFTAAIVCLMLYTVGAIWL